MRRCASRVRMRGRRSSASAATAATSPTNRARACSRTSSTAGSATWCWPTFPSTTTAKSTRARLRSGSWRSTAVMRGSASVRRPVPSIPCCCSPLARSRCARPGSWRCSDECCRERPMIPRYSRPEMVALWTPERRYQTWLQVELAAGRAMADAGVVPREAIEECARKGGTFTAADAARTAETERTTRHAVIAFLTFMEERIGPAARHLHFGMTSSDVLDTSLALLLRDAADLLVAGVEKTREAVVKRAIEHKRTPCIGRSHGIHAEPTTFGWKLIVWADELARAKARLHRAREIIAVGKLSGAVGTFAHLSPAIEEKAMAALGLRAAPASTQIVQRDRHAEYFTALALAGDSIEKFAVEIRHLQRTEVREVEEG